MIRATTSRLIATRLVNPSHLCAGVASSSLQQHCSAAASRSLATKREIGEGMDEEKMRPGERSQVLEVTPKLSQPASTRVFPFLYCIALFGRRAALFVLSRGGDPEYLGEHCAPIPPCLRRDNVHPALQQRTLSEYCVALCRLRKELLGLFSRRQICHRPDPDTIF